MLGVAVDGRGRVYACDDGNGEVARWDPATGEVDDIRARRRRRGHGLPERAAFGPDGMLYVTCSGEDGRPEILRIAPGGAEVERWTDAVPGYPNGALVDAGRLGADRRRVARAAARAGRDRRGRSRGRVSRDRGRCPTRTPTAWRSPPTGPCGSRCIGPTAWCGSRRTATSEVVVDDHLAQTFDAPTNLAWVGAELDRVVVANVGDTFLSIGDVGVAGDPLHYPIFD